MSVEGGQNGNRRLSIDWKFLCKVRMPTRHGTVVGGFDHMAIKTWVCFATPLLLPQGFVPGIEFHIATKQDAGLAIGDEECGADEIVIDAVWCPVGNDILTRGIKCRGETVDKIGFVVSRMSIAWPQKLANHGLIGNRKLFIALEETKLRAIRLLWVDLVENLVTNGRDLKRESARRFIEQLFNRELNRRGSQGVQKSLQIQRLKALKHPDLPNPATILFQHMAEAPSMVFMRMRQADKCE